MTTDELRETWQRLRRTASDAIRKDHPPAPDEAAQMVDDALAVLQQMAEDVHSIAIARGA